MNQIPPAEPDQFDASAGSPAEAKMNSQTEPAAQTVIVTVTDPLGLHLRSSKEVVRVANRFHAHIIAENISRESAHVDVKSILQLMQLQARQGHMLQISASGPDAYEAIVAITALF